MEQNIQTRVTVTIQNFERKPTVREQTLLFHLCNDKNTKEIAAEMGFSPRTIESFIDKIYGQTGLETRAGLAAFAVRNGIDKLPESATAKLTACV